MQMWTPPRLSIDDIEDPKQKSFLQKAESRPDATGLNDFLDAVGVEELKKILIKLAFRVEPPEVQVGGEICACVTLQYPDKPADAVSLEDDLRATGINVFITDSSEVNTTPGLQKALESVIKMVDAIIIYYGRVNPLMVQSLLVYIRKQRSRLREPGGRS